MKAILFDLDGTLADTVESIAFATNKVLEEFGLDARPVEEYNYYAGDGADTLVVRALKAAGDSTASHFDEAYKKYKEFFEKDCTYQVKHFNGMKETLDKLKEKGIKLAVVTNKPHERAITVVEYLFGKNYFHQIIGQQEGLPKKPDPTGALRIAKQFSIEPKDCLYVGDTNVDMKTGKAAGMFTVGVLWGFRGREELEANHADVIIEKPEELLKFI